MKFLLLTLCSLILIACQSKDSSLNQSDIETEVSKQKPIGDTTGEFVAEIVSFDENSAVVLAEDLSGYPNGSEISVSLPEGEGWEIGDVVRVEYAGGFMESHPMQIKQKSIKKVQ
ncbi:hypothetical protein VXN63_09560 [Marinilactibacillus sp. XAAS-LB27]|uniref:hypothetical protein n=1 Tax=Marinilactibacillus sp. XAAS-LB27 TaxID=3114538 RepID=UPI002E1727E8|nr:hypothetical protein [Marinilactibacillus sp. XAAS-LB27]